jgi:hypothetical protein
MRINIPLFLLTLSLLVLPVAFAQAAAVPVFDWVHAYTGANIEAGVVKGVGIDPSNGAIYFANGFNGTGDIDPTSGTQTVSSAGSRDASLTKFSEDGSFEWALLWGGTGSDSTSGVDVAADGNVFVATTFTGTVDFDPGVGTTNGVSWGSQDMAVSKFDSDGVFQWVRTWGGVSAEAVVNVAVAPDGGIYVLGIFQGQVDFDPGVGTASSTSAGNYDVALSKFAADGTFQWAKTWGGTGFDSASGIAFDSTGDIVVGGLFAGTVDFDPSGGTDSHVSAGGFDIWISRFSSDGTFEWAKTWGGTGSDFGQAVGIDADDIVYAGSYFEGTVDFDPSGGTDSHVSSGSSDAALSAFSADGTFEWSEAWGGTGSDYVSQVVFDDDGTIVVMGKFSGTVDLDPSGGTDTFISAGSGDISISRFDTDGGYLGARSIGGAGNDANDDAVVFESTLVLAGLYSGANTDFDPSSASASYNSDGSDAFLVSFDLIEPDITIEASGTALDEDDGDSITYTLVLTTEPTDDVIITITPDADVEVSTTTLTFTSTTWDTPQSVTVTTVDDSEDEATHTGTITHTVASDDTDYDGLDVDSVTITIDDDDGSGGGSSSSGGSSNDNDDEEDEDEEEEDDANDEAIVRLEALIVELKAKLAVLLGGTPAATINPFTRDLDLGATGSDVNALQVYLVKANKGPKAQALAANGTTQYFGPLTQAALAEFQASVGITPAVGYFGPKTRAYIASH